MKARGKYRPAPRVLISVASTVIFLLLNQLAAAGQEKEKSIALVFSPGPGQTLIYNLSSRMSAEGKSFLGKSLSLNATASGEIDVAIRQVSKENVFTELTSPGLQVALHALDELDEFTLAATAENPVQVIFDKTGRIRDVKNVAALEERNVLNFSIMDVLRNYLPSYPDRPVSVGDSWKDHKRMLIPFQGMNLAVEFDIIFLLNLVLPSPDGRLALISATCAVTLSGSRNLEEAVGSFEGKGVGSGNVNFLIDHGYFTQYRLDYNISGAMVVRRAGTKLLEWPVTLSASADLSLLEKREPLLNQN